MVLKHKQTHIVITDNQVVETLVLKHKQTHIVITDNQVVETLWY